MDHTRRYRKAPRCEGARLMHPLAPAGPLIPSLPTASAQALEEKWHWQKKSATGRRVTSCSWESFSLGQGKKIANGPCCSSAISIQTPLSKRWPDPAQLQAQFVTRGPPCPSPSVAAGEQEGARGQHSSHYLPHLLLIWASRLTTTNPLEDKQGQED